MLCFYTFLTGWIVVQHTLTFALFLYCDFLFKELINVLSAGSLIIELHLAVVCATVILSLHPLVC